MNSQIVVVDSSAIIAVLRRELYHERLAEVMVDSPTLRLCSANHVEVCAVLYRQHHDELIGLYEQLRVTTAISLVPVSETIAVEACSAYGRFGRGRHPAALNSGDCFAYATAKALDAPLFYVGKDFGKTDIHAALPV